MRKIICLSLFLITIFSLQAQDVVTNTNENKASKKSALEVLFSPEYMSFSNIMFKTGDSDIIKCRVGILFHSSTARTGLLNQMGQFNVGIQVNKAINDKSNVYGLFDLVGFNRFETLYDVSSIEIITEHIYGIGAQLGIGFDYNLNEMIYLGVETGAMMPYEQNKSENVVLLSANSGLRLGIRF